MGCCGGDREKHAVMKNDVKWEYVNLNDFKSTSCFTPLAYIWLWLMLFVSISVYAVDTFTAVNLLAFNRWAGQIEPALELQYSRWIFAGCIILSFVLLIYRWLRALKVMRGGKVAKAYLDPLAVRVECIRMGQEGRGWKRFLVFAELTKSRKGADYVALFAYYSFEAWLRILFAEGPRVVINGMTLVAYAQANFLPVGEHADENTSPFVQFWKNVGVLTEDDTLQATIIFGMLWTCLIWLLSAISLGVSVILYLIFLWHHIPSSAGGLTGYCRTKINRRMERIVKTKTDKALKKENEIRARREARAFREGGGGEFKRQPTLPDVAAADGSTPTLSTLSRQTTMTTLPEYSSRSGTAPPSEEHMPQMPQMPPIPAVTPIDTNTRPAPRRHMTKASDASWSSYNSNAPLMSTAGDMGYSPHDRIQTPASSISSPWSARSGPYRNFTGYSDYSDRSYTPGTQRPLTSQSQRDPSGSYQMEPLPRPGTGMSNRSRGMRQSSDSVTLPPASVRGMTPVSAYPQSAGPGPVPLLPDYQRARTPAAMHNPYLPPHSPIPEYGGRESPAFMAGAPLQSHTPTGPLPRTITSGHAPPLHRLHTAGPAPNSGGYIPFNPSMGRTESPHHPSATIAGQPYNPYIDRVDSPAADGSANDAYRSFSRPFPCESDRVIPQNNGGYYNSNLYPPGQNPPPRAGSFDDILDHY